MNEIYSRYRTAAAHLIIFFSTTAVTLCTPNPCKNGGKCQVMSRTNFRCDCSNTGFRGELCKIGVVKAPEIPQLLVGVTTDDLLITAKPNENLIFTLAAEPADAVEFKPTNTLFLYTPREKVAFQITAKREGVVRISYRIAGANFLEFEQPADTVVLVQKHTDQRMSVVPDTSFVDKNCYDMTLDQCGDSGKLLSLQSSCPWTVSGSKGYISVRAGQMNLPVSLAGVVFQNKDGVQTFRNSGVMTVSRESQSMLVGDRLQCDAKDACQGVFSMNQAGHDFLIQRNIFLRSYLVEFLKGTPWWLALIFPLGYTGFHVNDIQSLIVKDDRIKDLKCANIPSSVAGIYSAAIFQAPVEVKVLDSSVSMESPEHACFLKSLCGEKTFISFPKDVSKEISVGGSGALTVNIQGFGFDSGKSFTTKEICRNVSSRVGSLSDSFGRVQKCVRANSWFKGSVSLKTFKSTVDFQGEVFAESDNFDKVSVFFFLLYVSFLPFIRGMFHVIPLVDNQHYVMCNQ